MQGAAKIKRIRSNTSSDDSDQEVDEFRAIRPKRQTPGELRLQNDVTLIEKYSDDATTDVSFEYYDRQGGEVLNIMYVSSSLSVCPNNFQLRVKKYYPHDIPEVTCLDPGFECQYITATGRVLHESLRVPKWTAVNGLSDVVSCLREIRNLSLWGGDPRQQKMIFSESSQGMGESAYIHECGAVSGDYDIEIDPQELIVPRGGGFSGAKSASFSLTAANTSSSAGELQSEEDNEAEHSGSDYFSEGISQWHQISRMPSSTTMIPNSLGASFGNEAQAGAKWSFPSSLTSHDGVGVVRNISSSYAQYPNGFEGLDHHSSVVADVDDSFMQDENIRGQYEEDEEGDANSVSENMDESVGI